MRNIAYTVWSTGESRNCHLTTFVVVKRLIKTITLKECGLNKKIKNTIIKVSLQLRNVQIKISTLIAKNKSPCKKCNVYIFMFREKIYIL